MKNRYYFFIPVCLLFFYSFTNSNYEKKKISNKLYSFSVPENWTPNLPPEISDDGFTPGERDAYKYHLYYLLWSNSSKNLNRFISLFIESYNRLDNQPLSIKEIEDVEMDKMKLTEKSGNLKILERKEIKGKSGQKRFIIKEESIEIDVKKGGKMVKHSRIYLLQKNGNIVHCACIFVPEEYYLLPETQGVIDDILDSFSVNSGKN
ncbi:hypothetical protein FACS189474_3250 [Bacteroidia bacterium]|nr:hypothetical protein FACS189440_15160 [Bacteroidia bacterium]GHT88289.1 hypothetical protein FACS189474_3250 [Bacteroidia bacterium]